MSNLYDFQSCDYAEDFECLIDIHNYHDWFPEETCDLWLKAYDVSCCENSREVILDDEGYAFDCYVWLSDCNNGNKITAGIQPRPAKDEQEAEEMLIKMAESVIKNVSLLEKLKDTIVE